MSHRCSLYSLSRLRRFFRRWDPLDSSNVLDSISIRNRQNTFPGTELLEQPGRRLETVHFSLVRDDNESPPAINVFHGSRYFFYLLLELSVPVIF